MIYCTEWEPSKEIRTLKSSSPKEKRAFLEEWLSLDTETSHNHDIENPIGWIYQWAFCFAGDIVVGRKPSELIECFNKMIRFYELGKERKLIIYVHNLSYDWTYLVDWLEEEYGKGKTLAIRSHRVISYTNDYFCFKCSYMLSNKSLAKWSKDLGCTNRKLEGFVDYEVVRYQDSELTTRDWAYMIADVETLHECIKRQLQLYNDNIVTVPLTATGYIRREIRRNFNKDNHNFKRFQQTRLSVTTYQLCRREFAGGFTHGDRYKAGMTIEPGKGDIIKHRDFRSHYPSQQRVRNFPVGKFNLYATDTDLKTIQAQLDDFCILVDCTITNILIKSEKINFPYLQESKCKEGHIGPFRTLADNGRILSFTGTTNLVFNEHDLYWFLRQYNYQEIRYNALYVSKKGPLPAFMRDTVDEFMFGKTKYKELEKAETDPEKKLDYALSLMKSKNGLNAIYGCSATDPVRNEVTWEDMENWKEEAPGDLQGALDKFYNSRNNCMRYQWGCWTTSNARHELFTFAYDVIGRANGGEGIEATGCLYMDTDSIFYISNPETEKAVEDYNEKLREKSEKIGAFIEYEGKKVHYDQFCDEEEEITAFRFLHAKCYAYEEKTEGLKCVIAGVPARTIIGTDKEDKPIYYTRDQELGEIDNLTVGKVFKICGGASISYFAQQPTEINIEGHRTEIASCAIITSTEKTLKHECEKHLDILEGLIQSGRHQNRRNDDMKIKYIQDKQTLGIEYDWGLIRKEYNKLGVPGDYYDIPWKAIQEGNKYIMSLSERSTGKTTNLGLLVGLVMNKIYKTQVVYIRPTEDELSASHAQKLVDVIKTYKEGQYIKALTDGEYNSIYYHWRQFFYCFVDETGEIVKKSTTPIIQMLSVARANDYKSTLNLPLGDWIVYDEFIGKYYRPDEAIHFLDLLKTIIRDRLSPVVCMLANTINLNSQYFEEFEISREVKKLNKGDKFTITTDRGTKIYVEIVNLVRHDNTHSLLNSMFYGFKNPKIASITGGEVWAFECVPHILRDCTDKRVLARNLYIESGLELLQIEIVYNKEQSLHLEIHRASKTYPDSIIFTIGDQKDIRYYFGLGHGNLNRLLTKYITERKVYYSSNEVGSIFKDYLNRYLMIKNQY